MCHFEAWPVTVYCMADIHTQSEDIIYQFSSPCDYDQCEAGINVLASLCVHQWPHESMAALGSALHMPSLIAVVVTSWAHGPHMVAAFFTCIYANT